MTAYKIFCTFGVLGLSSFGATIILILIEPKSAKAMWSFTGMCVSLLLAACMVIAGIATIWIG